MSVEVPTETTSDLDIGDFLEVPESEREEVDTHVSDEINEDEFLLLADVPEGDEIVTLSTANLDEEA